MFKLARRFKTSLTSLLESVRDKELPKIDDIIASKKEKSIKELKIPNYVDQYTSTGIIKSYTDIIREERSLSKPEISEKIVNDAKMGNLRRNLHESITRLQVQEASKNVPFVDIKPLQSSLEPSRQGLHRYLPVPESARIRKFLPFVSPDNARLLKISIMGPANSGKSTFMNRITGNKLSITSSKAQTTRENVSGIVTFPPSGLQLVFYDTPGLAPPNKSLPRDIAIAPWQAAQQVDCILFFCNGHIIQRQYSQIRHYLTHIQSLMKEGVIAEHIPVHLVVNMMDLVSFSKNSQKDVEHYSNILVSEIPIIGSKFCVSSLTGSGVHYITKLCDSLAVPAPWMFSPLQHTTYSDFELVHETIREKIYRRLNQEIPYALKLDIVSWDDTDPGQLKLVVDLYVPDASCSKIVIGKAGDVIHYIRDRSQESLSASFGKNVSLFITVKLPK